MPALNGGNHSGLPLPRNTPSGHRPRERAARPRTPCPLRSLTRRRGGDIIPAPTEEHVYMRRELLIAVVCLGLLGGGVRAEDDPAGRTLSSSTNTQWTSS